MKTEGLTMNQLAERNAEYVTTISKLAEENAALKEHTVNHARAVELWNSWADAEDKIPLVPETPATDTFLAEVRAKAHKEGAYFVANRMLAAWEAGFIEDTEKNAADIARMILTSTDFMADAPEGDFDRAFADGVLEEIAAKLSQEAAQ